jgi:hypothetical protein
LGATRYRRTPSSVQFGATEEPKHSVECLGLSLPVILDHTSAGVVHKAQDHGRNGLGIFSGYSAFESRFKEQIDSGLVP